MIYTIEQDRKVNLKAKGIERILQNCCNILSVVAGEVVLGRRIGINGDIVDTPLNRAKKTLNIKSQLETYEPRAKVKKIKYKTEVKQKHYNQIKPIATTPLTIVFLMIFFAFMLH